MPPPTASFHPTTLRPTLLAGCTLDQAVSLLSKAFDSGCPASEWAVPGLGAIVTAAVRELRRGDLDALVTSARALRGTADGATGAWLATAEPEAPVRLRTVAAAMTAANASRDDAAVASILRLQHGRGQAVLDHLATLPASASEPTQRELCERLGAPEASLSRLLEVMDEAGLVARLRDGTANRVALTSTGRARAEKAAFPEKVQRPASARRKRPLAWVEAALNDFENNRPGRRLDIVKADGPFGLLAPAS